MTKLIGGYQRGQWLLIGAAVLAVLLMFVFARYKPLQRKGEAEAKSSDKLVTAEVLVSEGLAKLDSAQLAWWEELENQRRKAEDLKQQAEVLKLMSRAWNEWENFALGGVYAAQAAELLQSAEAWAITGTTFGIAFQRGTELELKQFAARQAISAFEQAAKLEPDSIRHRLNEALIWVDLAGVDPTVMPMEGVQRLRGIEADFPDNVLLNLTLGRLSFMRTGDLDKGIPRLEKVLSLAQSQPVSKEILLECHYFLGQGYEKQGDKAKALSHYEAGLGLTEDPEFRRQLQELKGNLSK